MYSLFYFFVLFKAAAAGVRIVGIAKLIYGPKRAEQPSFLDVTRGVYVTYEHGPGAYASFNYVRATERNTLTVYGLLGADR